MKIQDVLFGVFGLVCYTIVVVAVALWFGVGIGEKRVNDIYKQEISKLNELHEKQMRAVHSTPLAVDKKTKRLYVAPSSVRDSVFRATLREWDDTMDSLARLFVVD
jgi:hypothetical protein